jgi:hypothetical protein
MRTAILIIFLTALFPAFARSAQAEWGPWNWDAEKAIICTGNCPVPEVEAREVPTPVEGHPLKVITNGVVRFYQVHLNKHRTTKCPMYPVCSRFAILSLRKYGPVMGTLMTLDRLYYRENNSMSDFYQSFKIDGFYKYYDPPENNYIFTDEKDIKLLP